MLAPGLDSVPASICSENPPPDPTLPPVKLIVMLYDGTDGSYSMGKLSVGDIDELEPPWQLQPDAPELCRPEELPSDNGTVSASINVNVKKIVVALALILSFNLGLLWLY